MRPFARDLQLLVTLSGEENDISRPCFTDGQRNRLVAIDLDGIFRSGSLETYLGVVDDGAGVLAAGIVGGEHDKIAAAPGCLAHERTLGTVAVAATTE